MRYVVMHKSIHSCVAGPLCWIHQTIDKKKKKKFWKVGEGLWNNQEQVKIPL